MRGVGEWGVGCSEKSGWPLLKMLNRPLPEINQISRHNLAVA